jgi:hypothetical protein
MMFRINQNIDTNVTVNVGLKLDSVTSTEKAKGIWLCADHLSAQYRTKLWLGVGIEEIDSALWSITLEAAVCQPPIHT